MGRSKKFDSEELLSMKRTKQLGHLVINPLMLKVRLNSNFDVNLFFYPEFKRKTLFCQLNCTS